jgi:hypothetical protein
MADEVIVMRDSDEAAQLKTVTGWVSRDGMFFGNDERTARWSGCTHEVCEGCGNVIPRGFCNSCRVKSDIERWKAAERAPYDGTAMLYSDLCDQYFRDEDEAREYAENEGYSLDYLRLYICEPQYGRLIEDDYFCDQFPENGEVPESIREAMDVLNKAIREAGPLSWYPGKTVPILYPIPESA